MTFLGKTISLEDVPKDTDAVLLTLKTYRELERLLDIFHSALQFYANSENWQRDYDDYIVGDPGELRAQDSLKEISRLSQSEGEKE